MSALGDESLELRDVPGPSALGGGWRRAAELLYLIAVTDFKRTYFGTVLGYAWSLARPLMLFGILLAVFTKVFHLAGHVPHYPVFLLFDIVLITFFQEATSLAVGSIVMHESVVRKTQFPRLVIPLSVVLTSLFNLGLNMVVAFIFILAFGVSPAWTWLLMIVILLALFVLTTAVSMIVSALYPRFRDVQIIWTVASTALFYGTPVLYPITVVSHTLRDVIALNPLAPIFELAQRWVTNRAQTPWPWDAAAGGPVRFAIAVGLYVVICVLAVWVFNREAPRIAEAL
jgi:ABC-2 type transport system permease protein